MEGKEKKIEFTTPWHNYNLFFHPNAMYQVNLKTGTKRQVKRRPDRLVAHEDVEDLKWEQIRKGSEKYKYVPSHWSPMPPNSRYERVAIDAGSSEFQGVEQLFRRTMNDYAVIVRIERVQNPFMMEKYCR